MGILILLLLACSEDTAPDRSIDSATLDTSGLENILIVVIDDIGIDKIGAYGTHPQAPATPFMDALAANGVRFEHAYAHPTCTPTRAALMTGQYASRAGIGTWIDPLTSDVQLDPSALTLPRVVAASQGHTWATAAVGKWHLTGFQAERPGLHPLDCGFDTHRGSLANPSNAMNPVDSNPRGYSHWEKFVDGEPIWSTHYMTTDTVDDAIQLAAELREPWLLYVAFNAAHTPLHVPPQHLLQAPLPAAPTDTDMFGAMVTALDTELGRLLEAVTDHSAAPITTLLIGDNGTPSHAILPPLDPTRGKGTVSEGGVRVPFIVAGPRVGAPGTVSHAPVHIVDVLPTIAAIAGVTPSRLTDTNGDPWPLDGYDLTPVLAAPARAEARLLYSEMFSPNGPPPWSWYARTLRDDEYKLIEVSQTYAFFQLSDGFDEGDDLLPRGLDADAQAAFDALVDALKTMAE